MKVRDVFVLTKPCDQLLDQTRSLALWLLARGYNVFVSLSRVRGNEPG